MPVALIRNNCLHHPDGRDAQFLIPLKVGQKPEEVDLANITADMLIPSKGGVGHVVAWSYGGTMKITRVGKKVFLSQDHADWLMNKIPGMIELVADTDDGDETVQILSEQNTRLRDRLTSAETRAQVAEERLRSIENQGPQLEAKIIQLTHQREEAIADAQRLRQELELLSQHVKTLERSPTGRDNIEAQTKLQKAEAYIALLEQNISKTGLAKARESLGDSFKDAPPPVSTATDDDGLTAEERQQLDEAERVRADEASSAADKRK